MTKPLRVRRPTLDEVLAQARPGRQGRLLLTDEQRQAFSGERERRFLRILRALLRARADAAPHAHGYFPVTPTALQRVGRKVGEKTLGIKILGSLIHRAVEAGLLVRSGAYTARSRTLGDRRVPLYTLGTKATDTRCPASQPTVGKHLGVHHIQPLRWWQHGLFGDADGLPPPGVPARRL